MNLNRGQALLGWGKTVGPFEDTIVMSSSMNVSVLSSSAVEQSINEQRNKICTPNDICVYMCLPVR